MTLDDFMRRLEGVRPNGKGFTARCPGPAHGHGDRHNSLSVTPGDDGRILLNCFTGCSTDDIVSALGLTMADLMPPKDNRPRNETVYKLVIGPGDVVEHVRVEKADGSKDFFWRRNGQSGLQGLKVRDLPLYRPDRNRIWEDGDRITICEGEKAAIAAEGLGLAAYGTVCGAAACPSVSVLKPVCAGRHVLLWADNDDPGRAHMKSIAGALTGLAASVTTFWTGGPKDDAADYEGTLADLNQLIESQKHAGLVRLGEVIHATLDDLARYSAGDYGGRVQTGIDKLDQALRGGMMPGAVYLLGAPSGHGKTTIVQEWAFRAAAHGPVLIVSPEMSTGELAERAIIRRSLTPLWKRAPWMPADTRRAATLAHMEAATLLRRENLPVYVLDDSDVDMGKVMEKARALDGVRLVVIDYAQEVADKTSAVRYRAVGEVASQAIALGRELGSAILVASQVNIVQESDGSTGYRFRETAELESRSHCSMIFEIKRKKQPNERGFCDVDTAHLIARKNRSGPLFRLQVDYRPDIYFVSNYKPEEAKPWAPPDRGEMEEGY